VSSYWYAQPDDSLLDNSGLSRDEKRAALIKMQDGRCAICPSTAKLIVDHDHETGLVRGLLCRRCNQWEGQSRSLLFSVDYPDVAAYLAAPPAAGLGWMWDLPDPPGPTIEEAIAELQTVDLTNLNFSRRMTSAQAVAALQDVDLPELGA
jgi:hypothetical protein